MSVNGQSVPAVKSFQKIVTAMGASLSIVAKFPDGSHWELRV